MPQSQDHSCHRHAGAILTAACLTATALLGGGAPAFAEQPSSATTRPHFEQLDRGLVALKTESGVFLSWRLLGGETRGSSEHGMAGADFAVYRGTERIATVSDSTNYLDSSGTEQSSYRVAPVVNGVELDASASVAAHTGGFLNLPLQKPEPGVTPAGEDYSYSANDLSVGDVDGDGTYEYIVKWDPSNSKDVSQKGYTGNTYIDTYTQAGELLHRIDLGVNVRSGAHYTQFMVYDFDGDGRSEIMMKTAPGTRTLARGEASQITLPANDVAAGVSHQDDYRLSAEDYAEHLTQMLRGWADRAEVRSGQWPATLEEAWGIEKRWDYPLSPADATAAANYFIDEYAPSRSTRNLLRDFEGFIVNGPEYLTVFDGETGKELDTVPYEPARGDDGLLWGDYALSRIEPANRVDRFLAGVAYLDGSRPSAIFARGYYTRSVVAAYDFDGAQISRRWIADSGHVPMGNPFNDSPHGKDGIDPQLGSLASQGFHSLSAADVDQDGRQEIVYGSATLDDDGSLLYSSTAPLPEGSAAPGTLAKLGHGDAMHVTDIVPDRPGLEIFTVHENGRSAPYGWALRDAATGEVLNGEYSGRDTGRGMIGDIDPHATGLEYWASMPPGAELPEQSLGTNQSIRWSADMSTQIVEGHSESTPRIVDGSGDVLLELTGTRTNNGTKGNPGLVADVLGDWREELLIRDVNSTQLRIYLSTELTDRKLTTLMHNAQYRSEVARQNTSYNQPSYTDYMLASDIRWADVPVYATVVDAPAPVFVDEPGRGRDGYLIPETENVAYYVDGQPRASGFHRHKGEVQITAVPDPWFATTDTTQWHHHFTAGS